MKAKKSNRKDTSRCFERTIRARPQRKHALGCSAFSLFSSQSAVYSTRHTRELRRQDNVEAGDRRNQDRLGTTTAVPGSARKNMFSAESERRCRPEHAGLREAELLYGGGPVGRETKVPREPAPVRLDVVENDERVEHRVPV